METVKEILAKVPQDWEDMTVHQFQLIRQCDSSVNINTYLVNVIHVLTDVPIATIEELSYEDFANIVEKMKWAQSELKSERTEAIDIDGVTYKYVKDFNKLSVGEIVSIEQTIDSEKLTFDGAIDVVLAVLLRKADPDGSVPKFDADAFSANRDLFSELKITDVYANVSFFLNGGEISLGPTQESRA